MRTSMYLTYSENASVLITTSLQNLIKRCNARGETNTDYYHAHKNELDSRNLGIKAHF